MYVSIYLVAVWRCYSSEFWKVITLSPARYGSLSLLVNTFKTTLEVAIVIVFDSQVLFKLCSLTLPLKITMMNDTEVFRKVVSWILHVHKGCKSRSQCGYNQKCKTLILKIR